MAVKCKQHHNAFACFDSPNLGGSTILILGTDLFTAPLKKLTHFHSALLITLNLNNALQCDNVQMKNHRKAKRSQGMVPKVRVREDFKSDSLFIKIESNVKMTKNLFLPKNPEKWFWIRMKDDFVSQEKGREHHSARPTKKNILWLRYTNDILISCEFFSKGNSMSTQNSQ